MEGYDINSFPETEGLLLYNSKTKVYGLSFQDKYTLIPKVWILDKNRLLVPEDLFVANWTDWAPISAFYEYGKTFDLSSNAIFGWRTIRRGCVGKDVMILQSLLKKFDKTIEMTGIYNDVMVEKVKKIQRAYGFFQDGEIDKDNAKFMALIVGD